MSIGTGGNDTITSAFDYDVVSTLGGDDTLNAVHNGVILIGGSGDDDLDTTYTQTTELGSQSQLGGIGVDVMSMSVTGGNGGGSSTQNFLMDGGADNDTIDGLVQISSGGNVVVRGQVSGGTGVDNINIIANSLGSNSADVELVVDAGSGNDVITDASANAIMDTATASFANARQVIDLGGGNDMLDKAQVDSRSAGTSNVVQEVSGGSGNDSMTATVFVSSATGQTGGTTTVAQTLSGGVGDDSVTSQIDATFEILDNLTSTSDISTGGGADTINSTTNVVVLNDATLNHTISGGAGIDTIDVNHDVSSTSSGSVTLNNQMLGGGGNDVVTADTDINDADVGILFNNFADTAGVSTVDIAARSLTDTFALTTNTVTTVSGDDVIDLEAFSFVKSTGSTVANHVADARNTVNSGGGADTVTASAQAQSSGDGSGGAGAGVGAYALNFFELGAGADNATAGTFIFSDSNGGTGTAQVFMNGDSGADTLESTMSSDFSELFEVSFDSDIQGGVGDDSITSNIDAFGRNTISVDSDISGGSGVDNITSNIVMESFGSAVVSVTEDIDGGTGNDTIVSSMDSSQSPAMTGTAEGTILGGTGNDTITASTIGHLGFYDVNGQDGDDVITVSGGGSGGTQNILRGEAGDDTLTGGDGNDLYLGGDDNDVINASQGVDFLFGGLDADTFVFDSTTDFDANQFSDWDRTEDILQFSGLVDTGPAGLADDIDALISSFNDTGAGMDVNVTFTNGTSMNFVNQGTGSMTSIADLVDDASTQLIA